jgi:hypothetical protein
MHTRQLSLLPPPAPATSAWALRGGEAEGPSRGDLGQCAMITHRTGC